LIRPPEIAQLFVDLPERRIMERFWIVHSLFIPAFDLICNHRCFLQRNPIQERADFGSRRRVRQSLVCNRTHDLMPKRSVRMKWRRKSNGKKNGRTEHSVTRRGFHSENRRQYD
jgi:hypothetical protein